MSQKQYHSSNGSSFSGNNGHGSNGYNGNGYNNNGRSYKGELYRGEHVLDRFDSTDDEIDLKALFAAILRHKWSIIALIIAGGAIATWYANSLIPTYKGQGTMIIAANNDNRYSIAGSDINNLLSVTYGFGMGSSMANELAVMRSRQLSETIAQRILELDMMENGERYPLLWTEYPDNPTVVGTTGSSRLTTHQIVTNRIRNNLVILAGEGASLVTIQFDSPSPLEARDIVNFTMDSYVQYSTDQNRISAGSALEFLDRELERVSADLETNELRIRNFMDETGLVKIDQQTSGVISTIVTLETRRQELRVNRVSIDTAMEQYEDQLNTIKPGLADQITQTIGPTLQNILGRLAELNTERILLVENNPRLKEGLETNSYLTELDSEIAVLEDQVQKMSQQILANDDVELFVGFLSGNDGGIPAQIRSLRSQILGLQIQDAQLNAQIEVIDDRLEYENSLLEELPTQMMEFARLERDKRISEGIFLTINRQYSETSLWEQTQFGLGRPLDKALEPLSPYKPNKNYLITVGLVIGMILGFGSAIVRELLNRNIDGMDKLKDIEYPVLSVVPDFRSILKEKYGEKSKVAVKGRLVSSSWFSLLDNISPITESYRRLHNNIIYSQPDQEIKTILVTSPGKGEGKTTTAVNLAGILAESGKKVLMIDFDFRRPNLHKTLGESQTPGIMEMLFDDIPAEEIIRETAYPGIYCLTTGRRPPNPASVAQSEKLKGIISLLKDKFDYLIIDSAPYGIITDAAPMMKVADGIVVCIRFNNTQTNELSQTIENLERIRVNILGTVMVGYDHKGSSDYYYQSKYKYYSYSEYAEYTEDKEIPA